jgi:hypothetical protein
LDEIHKCRPRDETFFVKTSSSLRSLVPVSAALALAATLAGCGSVNTDVPKDASVDSPNGDAGGGTGPYTARRWALRAGASQPGPLFAPKLVYDDARKTVILYGGFAGVPEQSTPSDAMWELTATGWQKLCGPCLPGARGAHAMAYDPVRDRIVLFGGSNGTTALSTVFEWNGAWTQIATTGAMATPGARTHAALVYDRQHARMLLVGGDAGATAVADVWSYTAGAWALLQAGSTAPTELGGAGAWATYDPARGVLALPDNRGAGRDELWAWNDGWVQACDNCSGRARIAASLVYDPTLSTSYLINGYDPAARVPTEVDGTWKLTGNAFTLAAAEPHGRDSEGVAYDANRDVIVLYGGNGNACQPDPFNCAETWELVPDR